MNSLIQINVDVTATADHGDAGIVLGSINGCPNDVEIADWQTVTAVGGASRRHQVGILDET